MRLSGVFVAAALLVVGCSGSASKKDDAATPETEEAAAITAEELPADAADFYTVPDPLPAGEPGDLLSYQGVDGDIVPGTTVWRVMYLSESVQDEAIAVTGLVAIPNSPAPAEGRKILSIGHGTTGVRDDCTPSRSPGSELALLGPAADAGYVIAMTDYEGLGTPGLHPYLVGESEGRGILDAAKAARQLPDAGAGDRLAIWGYSQGGHAALWANQLAEEWAPELDLVGTVAGGPATEMPTIFTATGSVEALRGFFMLIMAGYSQAYPDADPSLVLTDAGMTVLDRFATGEDCDVDLSPPDGQPLVHSDFATAEPWPTLMEDNDPGHVAVDSPLLILHSAADQVVPASLSEALFNRLCGLDQDVERRVYDQGDSHVLAAVDAATDGLVWLEARMAGQPTTPNCP
jgi:dienelactone hydrolase